MIINFNEITKYYGANLILDKVSGVISKDSRIGIIGANGAGKTTLLKLISGVEQPDSGSLYTNPSIKLKYLTQNFSFDNNATATEVMRSAFSKELRALEEIERLDLSTDSGKHEYDRLTKIIQAGDAYNIDVKINYVLNGMGFNEKQKNQTVGTLSGGEKTRLALAKLLLSDADVLLLDEPTNHLDFKTCAWLENYLAGYKGAVVCVTHDRYFLDKTCTEIWEIEFGKINVYKGNYSTYKAEKTANLDRAEKEYQELTAYRNKLEDYIAKNLVRASTSKMAKSRRKELEKLEVPEKPREYNKQINIKFKFNKKSWFDALKCTDLSVKAGGKLLFSGLSLDIKAGEKVAIIGDNGAGKTTFFKTLTGDHTDYSGKIVWGKDIKIGVFEQSHVYSDPQKTVYNELWDEFPGMTDNEVRSHLAALLFSSDDIFKTVSDISGGESARLQLAALALRDCNTLMLDEPTNHLDMMSKERLEGALLEFGGTELIISHDRYLLNTLPDKIIYLSNDKTEIFEGKFDDYIKESERNTAEKIVNKKPNKPQNGYKTKEDRAAEAKKRAEISECEKGIALLESEISELEKTIAENTSDYETLTLACNTLEEKKLELDKLTERWITLSE